MLHIVALKAPLAEMTIYFSQKAQILVIIKDEALTEIPPKYADYADIFSFDLAMELPNNTGINEHTIKLEKGKQPLYRPIYSLGPMELETLKTYIEIHLKTGFSQLSKFHASAPILFDKKPNYSLWLYVNYWGFNNLTIQNQYPLPLIGDALNRLGRAKQFTQVDLTSVYHQMRIKESNEWKTTFRTWYGHFEY